MKEKYYLMTLFNPNTPSFCSFPIEYVGTEKEINEFIENIKNKELIRDIKKWFETKDPSITYYYNIPLLQEIEGDVIVKDFYSDYNEDVKSYVYMEEYESREYFFKIKDSKVYYFKHKNEFYRSYSLSMTNLSFENDWNGLYEKYNITKEEYPNIYIAKNLYDRNNGNIQFIKKHRTEVQKEIENGEIELKEPFPYLTYNKNQIKNEFKSIMSYIDVKFDNEKEMFKDIENPVQLDYYFFLCDC